MSKLRFKRKEVAALKADTFVPVGVAIAATSAGKTSAIRQWLTCAIKRHFMFLLKDEKAAEKATWKLLNDNDIRLKIING